MAKYKKLGKEALLAKVDAFASREVDVPEWETTVTIRELSGAERGLYEKSLMSIDKKTGNIIPEMTSARSRLVALCLLDDDGKRMFDNSDESVVQLGRLPAKGLDRIYEAAQELSGLTEDDVDEAVENFESATESSTSD